MGLRQTTESQSGTLPASYSHQSREVSIYRKTPTAQAALFTLRIIVARGDQLQVTERTSHETFLRGVPWRIRNIATEN